MRIVFVVLWRLRYKLALRDLPEMFLIRGIAFSHNAVRNWEPSWRRRWPKICGDAGTGPMSTRKFVIHQSGIKTTPALLQRGLLDPSLIDRELADLSCNRIRELVSLGGVGRAMGF